MGLATDDAAESAKLDAQITKTTTLVEEVDTYAAAYDKTFLAASKAVAGKLRDKAAPTDAECSEVSKQYNYLVDNYNHH